MKKAISYNKYILLAIIMLIIHHTLESCTRVMYQGPEGTVLTARSMDWKTEIPANLWIFPRGIEKSGSVGLNSMKWTSKYGSVIASAWDIASADGMNEMGLVANLLWLAESQYPVFDSTGTKKGLSIASWAQYVLDNFATVDEAVEALGKEEFVIVSATIPGTDRFTTLHLSVSDRHGDNAIFEYIDGRLIIHHNSSYHVMTNSPVFEQQLAINTYWEGIPGTIMLPGTNRAADRFVRASYYINAIPKTDNTRVAVASVFSVIRNCSVPYGISSPDEPNISSTRWRSVSDQKNLVYYFENVLTPSTFWVEMSSIDFSPGSESRKLVVGNDNAYCGDVTEKFTPSDPFVFAGL